MSVEQAAPLKEDPLVLVTFTEGEATRQAAIQAAGNLRAAGIRVELAEGKLKRVFEVANKLNARLAIICGENEVAEGALSIKDMGTHEQTTVSNGLFLDRVKQCLSKYL